MPETSRADGTYLTRPCDEIVVLYSRLRILLNHPAKAPTSENENNGRHRQGAEKTYLPLAYLLERGPSLVSLHLLVLESEINPGPHPIRFPCGECGKGLRGNGYGTACDTYEGWFHTRYISMRDTVLRPTSHGSAVPAACLTFPALFLPQPPRTPIINSNPTGLPVLTGSHPSHAGISRASSLTVTPSPLSAQFSSYNHNPLYIGDLPTTFLPTTTSPPTPTPSDCNSTASSSTSSSSYMSADQPTATKGSQSLRTLVINFQSLRPKKADLGTCSQLHTQPQSLDQRHG